MSSQSVPVCARGSVLRPGPVGHSLQKLLTKRRQARPSSKAPAVWDSGVRWGWGLALVGSAGALARGGQHPSTEGRSPRVWLPVAGSLFVLKPDVCSMRRFRSCGRNGSRIYHHPQDSSWQGSRRWLLRKADGAPGLGRRAREAVCRRCVAEPCT